VNNFMTEEQKELDWSAEADNLSEGSNNAYFKPDEGQTEITFLDGGTKYEDQKKFDDEPQTYVKFRVEVDGEEKVWDFGKGSTPGSKFGQIARYAKAKGGIEGETVTWFRQGTGQQTNHVLMDLSDLEAQDSGEDKVFDESDEKPDEDSDDELFDGEKTSAEA